MPASTCASMPMTMCLSTAMPPFEQFGIYYRVVRRALQGKINSCRRAYAVVKSIQYAGMAELADAVDLGSIGKPCRFESCYPHQQNHHGGVKAACCLSAIPFASRLSMWLEAAGRAGAQIGNATVMTRQQQTMRANLLRPGGWLFTLLYFYSAIKEQPHGSLSKLLPDHVQPLQVHTEKRCGADVVL